MTNTTSVSQQHYTRLVIARLVWVVCTVLAITCAAAGLWSTLYRPSPLTPDKIAGLQRMGISVQFYVMWTFSLQALLPLTFGGVGVLIFLKKSGDRAALVLSGLMIGIGTLSSIPVWQAFLAAWPHLRWLVLGGAFIGNVCLASFFYTFPNGHYVPRWTSVLALVTSAFNILNSYGFALPETLATVGRRLDVFFPLYIALSLGSFAVVPLYRYRSKATQVERQQIKFVVSTIVAAMIVFIATVSSVFLVPGANPETDVTLVTVFVQPLGWICAIGSIPLAVGIAILRYRLFDIDVIIRRTLVYGTLTAMLALIYLGSILVFQTLLRPLIGAESQLVTVVSTLMIAALFQPLRNRIQRTIDRRFYRRRYDSQQTLQVFGARLRSETDLGQLTDNMLYVVEETLQPVHVSLWLRPSISSAAPVAKLEER